VNDACLQPEQEGGSSKPGGCGSGKESLLHDFLQRFGQLVAKLPEPFSV